jgi:hypothetical protein
VAAAAASSEADLFKDPTWSDPELPGLSTPSGGFMDNHSSQGWLDRRLQSLVLFALLWMTHLIVEGFPYFIL